MALIQVNYLSKTLFRTVPVTVILPSDKIAFETLDYAGVPEGFAPIAGEECALGNIAKDL